MKRQQILIITAKFSLFALGWLCYLTIIEVNASMIHDQSPPLYTFHHAEHNTIATMKHTISESKDGDSMLFGNGADLLISQSVSQDVASVGDVLTYTITLTNLGSESSIDINLFALHSNGFDGGNPSDTNGVCSQNEIFNYYFCPLSSLPANESFTLVFSGLVEIGEPVVTNAIVWSASTLDPDDTNNWNQKRIAVAENNGGATRILNVEPDSVDIDVFPATLSILADNVDSSTAVYINGYDEALATTIDGNTLNVTLPNTLSIGVYDIIVSNDQNSDIAFSAFVAYRGNSLSYSNAVPQFGFADEPNIVEIHGEGFLPGIQIHLDKQANILGMEHEDGGVDLEQVYYMNDKLLHVIIPAELEEGNYNITLTNPNGNGVSHANAYEVVGEGIGDIAAIGHAVYIQPSGGPIVGQPATVGFRFYRPNGVTITHPITVNIYDNPPTQGGNLISTGYIDYLTPNGSAVYTAVWTPIVPGLYNLYAEVDPNNILPEFDETNNSDTHPIFVRDGNTDDVQPVISSFSINSNGRVIKDRKIISNLTISSNSVEPKYVLYMDHIYDQNIDDWIPVQSTGWLPYNDENTVDFPWHINPTPGTHYIQVWVSDELGNVTQEPGQQYITLEPSEGLPIAHGQAHSYRMYFNANEEIALRLTTLHGDADIYLYDPLGNKVEESYLTDRAEFIEYETQLSGSYQIEIVGSENSRYQLDDEFLSFLIPDFSPKILSAPSAIEGHVKGGSTPFFGIGTAPSNNPSLPIVPSLAPYTVYLPVIIR